MRRARFSCAVPAAEQNLCFRLIDSTIPLLPKNKISSLLKLYSPLSVGNHEDRYSDAAAQISVHLFNIFSCVFGLTTCDGPSPTTHLSVL